MEYSPTSRPKLADLSRSHIDVPIFYKAAAGNMYNINTEKNKFSEQHQDVTTLVLTSTQVFSDMFQHSREHQQGTCTT
jgi:hypothetical protein